jgi:tRNA (cytidine/uridine-2'-O-)-methyltransferase
VRIALFQPDMPPNVGAVIRTAACFNIGLDIIEPCGFPMSDRTLRRAALDYGRLADVKRHPGWATYVADAKAAGARLVAVETDGEHLLEAFWFRPDDRLVFGRETEGLPNQARADCETSMRIGLAAGARSLNLSVAAGITAWAMRTIGARTGDRGSDL